MADESLSENKTNIEEQLWYLNNYVLLRDYYDRTISRIAARCIRKGNIAIEDYPFYGYILDVLEEIAETGDYLIKHKELYPYIEKKIVGGLSALQKNVNEYKEELRKNASPEMIKQNTRAEVNKMKEALGTIDNKPTFDPTKGAGMSVDELMNKLMAEAPKEESVVAEPEKRMIKVKKPINQDSNQAVPEKISTEGQK